MPNYRRARTQGGRYFFTVTLADRQSEVLTHHIDAFRQAYRSVAQAHPFVSIAICVLPDHVHAVWQLPEDDDDYPMRWRLIKSKFSRQFEASQNRSSSKIAKAEKGIWQRRYWEHEIRGDYDLKQHVDYTHFNPVKHGHVNRVQDWPYSSFHQYVKRGDLPIDWGGGIGQ